MSATVEQVDLDAIERDVENKIDELRRAVSRLSLDVMSDSAVRAELIDVERELSDAQQELVRVALARGEQERREAEARGKALDARQRAAYRMAQKLQPDREKAATVVDEAAKQFVSAIAGWASTCREQQRALAQAGRPAMADVASPRTYMVEGALAKAMSDARWAKRFGGLHVWERLPLISPMHQKSLAASDARPVEPLEKK